MNFDKLNKLDKLASKPAKLSRSTPVLIRARCSGCGEVPSGLDFCVESFQHKNVYKIKNNSYRRRDSPYYYIYDGNRYYRRDLYAHSVDYKGYNPRRHNHTRCNDHFTAPYAIYVHCGCSNWVIERITHQDRPEISNRKTSILSKQSR